MTKNSSFKAWWVGGVCALALASGAVAQTYDLTRDFNIAAGDLKVALAEYMRQSGAKLIFRDDEVKGIQTAGVHGALSSEQALKLLLDGTSLAIQTDSSGARAIVRASGAWAGGANDSQSQGASPEQAPQGTGAEPVSTPESEALSEFTVTVTGTRIRGVAPVGSELVTIGREEIIQSGRTSVPDLLRIIPQIQTLGAGEAIVGTRSAGKVNNIFGAASVNLRGLGPDATLVLINGRRPAPTAEGAFVDVSQIPVSAIERVEVLPDGASALYGSDAIGGVINFVLRKNYEGAETALNYGLGSGLHSLSASQLFGKTWDSGAASLSYEYHERSNLPWYERSYYTGDLTARGGHNYSEPGFGSPGTIVSSEGIPYAIPHGQNGTSLTPNQLGPPGSFNVEEFQRGQDILPSQKRHSFTLMLNQKITDHVSGFVDAFFSVRNFDRRELALVLPLPVTVANPFFVPTTPGETEQTVMYSFFNEFQPRHEGNAKNFSVTLGSNVELPHGWNAEVSATMGQDRSRTNNTGGVNVARLNAALLGFEPADPALGLPAGAGRTVPFFNPYGDTSNGPTNSAEVLRYIAGDGTNSYQYKVNTFNVGANGALFDVPAGSVRLAVGAEARGEKYVTAKLFDVANAYHPIPSTENADSKRTVTAGYAELLVPFFGAANARAGLQQLDVSLAVRTEHFSDANIGSSTNPRIGVRWQPIEGLSFRTSWGTSFKAPRLQQLNEETNIWRGDDFGNPLATPGDPSTAEPGESHFIYLSGFGNRSLRPEKAQTLSLGFDFRPPQLAGFKAGVTYYSIKYKDRILFPSDLSLTNSLLSGSLSQVILALRPSQAMVDAIYRADGSAASAQELAALGLPSGQFLFGSQALPADQVFGIFSYTLRNYGVVNLDGLDLDTSYEFSNRLGRFTVAANASYLTNYDVQESRAEPILNLLSTTSSPVALRGRLSLNWMLGNASGGLSLNHVGGYDNTTRGDRLKVDPWTMFDLHLAYELNGAPGLFDGLVLGFDVQNLLDKDPPFVDNATGNVGFDPEMASPMGRIFALTVRKSW